MSSITRFEQSLQVLNNAFEQWVKRCGTHSGLGAFASIEIYILHVIGRAPEPRRIADICFALKIEDTHVVAYAVKKLMKAGLLKSSRSGKDTHFVTTQLGQERIASYAANKKKNLGAAVAMFSDQEIDIEKLSDQLQFLSAVYEQAARHAELQF